MTASNLKNSLRWFYVYDIRGVEVSTKERRVKFARHPLTWWSKVERCIRPNDLRVVLLVNVRAGGLGVVFAGFVPFMLAKLFYCFLLHERIFFFSFWWTEFTLWRRTFDQYLFILDHYIMQSTTVDLHMVSRICMYKCKI